MIAFDEHGDFYTEGECMSNPIRGELFGAKLLRRALALCLLVAAASSAYGGPNEVTLTFATVEQGRQILGAEDAFVERLSPFDRSARMKTDQEVSKEQYLAFVRKNVLQWDNNEKRRVESALRAIQPALTKWSIVLPKTVFVVKTTGAEEGDTTYTRGDAIVLPRGMLASSEGELQRILAHELFHILSRNDPLLRQSLYQTIGFQRCGEVELPPTLQARKITNPDTPINEHCIRVGIAGKQTWAIPILISRTDRYDVRRGGEFFDYLQFALLLVFRVGDADVARPLSDERGPKLVGVEEATDFFEQVGRNTRYVIHPDEILADNFALLILGRRDVPSPRVLERMASVFAQTRPTGSNRPVEVPKTPR